jgi:peptide/nickel transport system permease protein
MQDKNLKLKLGGIMAAVMVVLAVLAPVLPLQNPGDAQLADEFSGPSLAHPFGQDDEGRDVMARVIYGARYSLLIGFSTVLLSMTFGTLFGLIAGYFGGRIDEAFVFISDVFMAFPSILLIIAIAAFVPPSLLNIILVLSFVGWVSYARIVRGQVLAVKKIEYVQAAKALGFSHGRILLRHVLPNVLGPLIVNATLSLAGVIIAESTLSFLGLGVPQGLPSWGNMLDQGVAFLLIAPHLSIVPGFAIMWTVMAFNFFGDGLRDFYDVRS